jgi:hypothetical protein
MKTMTDSQMTWALKKGFAWADPANASEDCHCLAEIYWTREGGYMFDVDRQLYVMVI